MDINKIFEEELTREFKEKLKQYENKIYLSNEDVMNELGISSLANLRKLITQGKYKGLYEEKTSKQEHYRWNKFKFLKWVFEEKLKAIQAA